MKLAKFRISELSSCRGMGLTFQMTVTLKPIINVIQPLRWSLGRTKGQQRLCSNEFLGQTPDIK